jgi:rubredoxin
MNACHCSEPFPSLGAKWFCALCGWIIEEATPDYGDRTAPALPLSWFKEAA